MAGLHDTGGGGMDGLGVQSWTVAELSPCYPHLEASSAPSLGGHANYSWPGDGGARSMVT